MQTIEDILENLGHNVLVTKKHRQREKTWRDWYQGCNEWHDINIYNGKSNIKRVRKTLNICKKMCEDKADLLLNEKVNITVSESNQSLLDNILDVNNFWVQANELIEYANAFGTGAFVEYLDNNEISIDFVTASNIYPLRTKNKQIIDCAFCTEMVKDKGKVYFIQRHLKQNGTYVIYNDFYDDKGNKLANDTIKDVYYTKSPYPFFQIIRPNIANNFDITSCMGISCFANAIDDVKVIDNIYDSFDAEYNLSRKRVFVDDSMLNVDYESGQTRPTFDPSDPVFQMFQGQDPNSKIQEINGVIRYDAYISGLNQALDILSEKCGFGKGYYKFDVDNTQTATAIISQNSKLFRRIKKDEIILEKALTDMVKSILFLAGRKEEEISVSFDDSIIEDTEALAKRKLLEISAEIDDAVGYWVEVKGYTQEQAIEKIKEIQSRKGVTDETELGVDM